MNIDPRNYREAFSEEAGELVAALAAALRRLEGRPQDAEAFRAVHTLKGGADLGGPGLVAKLRAKPEFRYTPILVLTTESGEDRKGEGKAAGATGWIVKPLDPARLLRAVNRLVP